MSVTVSMPSGRPRSFHSDQRPDSSVGGGGATRTRVTPAASIFRATSPTDSAGSTISGSGSAISMLLVSSRVSQARTSEPSSTSPISSLLRSTARTEVTP